MIQLQDFSRLVHDSHVGILNKVKQNIKTLERIKVSGKYYISVKELNNLLNECIKGV